MTKQAQLADTRPQEDPGLPQMAAADPLRHVWVGASAGTGKTKVLIDRVLRLMLPRAGHDATSATRPEKILCLTYTKTAAAEMSNRIYARLGRWAVMEDDALQEDLQALNGIAPDAEMQKAARRLFARVLDAPGGLQIMTIHSFCQSVLKRFPIEAGLPPHFEMMDDQDSREYLERCQHDMAAAVHADPTTALAMAFSKLAVHLNTEDMTRLMSDIMAKRSLFADILATQGDADGTADNTVAQLYKHLKVSPAASEEQILADICLLPRATEADLRQALAALLQGGKTDQKKAAAMQAFLEQKENRAELFDVYRGAFLKGDGEVYAHPVTKAVEKMLPGCGDIMQREAARILENLSRLTALRFAQMNAALLRVGAYVIERYAYHKQMADRLDFEDLIIKTRALLATPEMVQWVLFKLDEGIDHILVDEAQDTSPHQWAVVRALAEEFLDGMGRGDGVPRTLFVVGDEKQSIFSFQGADPAAFDQMRKYFASKVLSLQDSWEILLEHSFRSTQTILQAVDDTFAAEEARQGVVAEAGRLVRHLVYRTGHAGTVELWPAVATPKKEETGQWPMPVDVEQAENAKGILAAKIAETIQDWLARGEILESQGRPIRAGDILILVQSRAAFVDVLMRALKEAHVPVSGIDRMTLSEEISVMDLLALAEFSLQPRDDLKLATILKSPLVGLSEEDLFDLCQARPASLWQAVQAKRPDVAQFLAPFVGMAGKATPYEFFAGILNAPCFADPVSGRRAFYSRLGEAIHDALDEFLNLCLSYEQSHTPALQKFIDWFLRGDAEIKREQEQKNKDLVRIMTVHGAKGLQAPIVFLPDATRTAVGNPRTTPRLLWPAAADGLPLWAPRKELGTPAYEDRLAVAIARQAEEYRRLLYVALTRAEDRLYVAGYLPGNHSKVREDSWHALVAASLPADVTTAPFVLAGKTLQDREGTDLAFSRLSHPQTVPAKEVEEVVEADMTWAALPAWAHAPPAAEPSPPQPLAPSRPEEEEPAVKGPLASDESWKFRRGNIMHGLLEILPQLPPARHEKALAAYLARQEFELSAADQKDFAKEIMTVLSHPDFAAIFGPGSRAEVPLVGLAGRDKKVPRILSGQIDRLLITQDEIFVIDYKTNRPPPDDAADVPVIYLKQMAAYKDLLRNIYPEKTVHCALLWTDKPFLMPLSDKLLDPYLP